MSPKVSLKLTWYKLSSELRHTQHNFYMTCVGSLILHQLKHHNISMNSTNSIHSQAHLVVNGLAAPEGCDLVQNFRYNSC